MNFDIQYILKTLSLILSGVFLICASFLIWNTTQKKDFPDGGSNISIILDVSQSMNVEDIQGDSRLSTAKNIIYTLLQKYSAAQFSLTIFAGDSQRILPFTSDIQLFATFLNSLDSSNIKNQGTNINAALQDGIESFGEEKTGTLILITDGDENSITLSSELSAAISDQELELIVIGVGKKQGGYIPSGDIFSPYKTYQGKTVIASLNDTELKKLATNLKGLYYSYDQNISLDLGKNNTIKNSSSIVLFFSFLFWSFFLILIGKQLYYK